MNSGNLAKTMTVRSLLEAQAGKYGEKTFLFFPEQNLELSYRHYDEMTARTANLLLSLGVQKGDKVAIMLPNIPEFLYFYWGCMKIGAVAGPINTLLKGPEVQYITHNCEAKVFVTTPEYLGEISRIRADLPQVQHYILVQDIPEATGKLEGASLLEFEKVIDAHSPTLKAIPIDPDDEAMIIYTSGTTGKPKGVLLTHHNLLVDAQYISEWFKLTPDTRMMCILPLFHVNGEVVTMMTPLFIGGSVVLNRRFSASTFWEYIATYRVNLFSTVPTILSILLANPKPAQDISCLEFGICGAAPLPVEVHKSFEAAFGVPIFEGYGLSETTCYSTFNPPDLSRRKIGSIGMAVGNQVAIWDEQCRPVAPGVEGEIVIRGENVMKGYFQLPEATEKAFQGGWFHSGDWGRMDEEGFFYILDRVKDMIIRGGENIYPREIDEVLYQHPKIEAAATIGVPDPKYGEEIKSFVVVKPGQVLSEEEVLLYCRERMADFKCPKSVAFIEEIPKGPTGKLLRKALRELENEKATTS